MKKSMTWAEAWRAGLRAARASWDPSLALVVKRGNVRLRDPGAHRRHEYLETFSRTVPVHEVQGADGRWRLVWGTWAARMAEKLLRARFDLSGAERDYYSRFLTRPEVAGSLAIGRQIGKSATGAAQMEANRVEERRVTRDLAECRQRLRRVGDFVRDCAYNGRVTPQDTDRVDRAAKAATDLATEIGSL